MQIYNTLTEKKEDLKKSFGWLRIKPFGRHLKMFVCGPTVYDDPHIGNGRTFVFFDLFVRYLRSRGFKIDYLMNITNIDDKIIARAKELKEKPQELADRYERVFHENMETLNVSAVTKYARATEFIPQIIKQIQRLIKRGHVYKIDQDGWYFDLTTFAEYGKLSHRTTEQAEDGVSRIDDSDKKRNTGDFCVWKLSVPPQDLPTLIHAHHQKTFRLIDGEPSWETPLGWGRPGWHIEDTAITEHFFGPQYDIHGGALDLKFPHHEAEIAQQESASGKKPLAKFWMHSGFLTVNGEKMSKSRGNFLTITQVLQQYSGDVFRMAVFSHHYRSPVDYTENMMEMAKKNTTELRAFAARLMLVKNRKSEVSQDLKSYVEKYHAAMADDFNTPKALAMLFELMNDIYPNLWKLSKSQAVAAANFVRNALTDLGFQTMKYEIPAEVKKRAQERELSRVNKQFTESDRLRKEIEELGYTIEDTPAGPLILPKN